MQAEDPTSLDAAVVSSARDLSPLAYPATAGSSTMNDLPRTFCNLVSATYLVLLGIGVASCGDDAQAVETRREIHEAAEATGDLVARQWNELMNSSEEQLTQMRAKYEELKAEASDATGEAKEAWDRQSAELKEDLNALGDRLDEARDEGADKLDEVGDDLKAGFNEARQRLSKAAEALRGK